MAGHHQLGSICQSLQCVEGLEHGADVEHDGERPFGLEVLVVVGGVRGQDQPADIGPDSDHLQTVGVATNTMHRQTWRQLVVAVMESHPVVVHEHDHVSDV